MGLLRMATRTAVVAGTATAVSGRVARRQNAKYEQKDQAAAQQEYQDQQYQQAQYAQQAPPQYAPPPQQYAPPPPAQEDVSTKIQNLAQLHSQGALSDAEFAAAKAKVLGI